MNPALWITYLSFDILQVRISFSKIIPILEKTIIHSVIIKINNKKLLLLGTK